MGSSMSRYKRAPIYYACLPSIQSCIGNIELCYHDLTSQGCYKCYHYTENQSLYSEEDTTAIFHSVDWGSHERYLNSIPQAKKTKVIKYMHNWQTTGRQKQLFSDVHDTDISLCPFGCGQSENPQHYLQCLVPPNPDESRTCFRSIASWMKKSLTHPVLQVIIIKAMKIWLKGDSPSAQDITLENEEYEDEIIQAHTNQHAIGWNNFVKERLSKRWSEIQQSHYNMMNRHRNTKCQDPLPPKYSSQWWSSNLI